MASIWSDFISLFFPNYCLGCTDSLVRGEEIICTRCLLQLPTTKYHEWPDNPIKNRLQGRIPLKYALALLKFRKTGITQHLLHQLKYNNHPEIGIRLGKFYGKELLTWGYQSEFDLIVPVPLHVSRKRRRGYNQSAMFAQGLSEELNIPCCENCVIRKIPTTTQTRKTRIERWENVKDVFMVTEPGLISNRRVLLVDDVITTGATLEACANQLLQQGCSEISIACLAEA
jgi:ComF family protein